MAVAVSSVTERPLPAEVVDAWWWQSTDDPVGHVRTRCLARHVFTWPSRLLTPAQL